MIKFTHVLLTTIVLAGCGGAQTNVAGQDAKQRQSLKEAIAQRDQVAKEVSAETPAIREKCESLAGDCLIQVRERRAEFFNTHETLECPPATMPDERMQCIVGQVSEYGSAKEADLVIELYQVEARCLAGLIRCAGDVKKRAAIAAIEQRTEQRRQQVENAPASVDARIAVEASVEKIKYVRLTFPIQTDSLCAEAEAVEKCISKAEETLAPLDGMLRQDPGYDEKAAMKLYQTSKQSEAACHDPELQCLAGKLKSFGVSPETRPFMQKNLALIEQRQKLVDRVDQAIAQQCIQQGVNKHQADVLQRFQDYARESKMYFRLQLDRAFVALHSEQVECLKNQAKPSSG